MLRITTIAALIALAVACVPAIKRTGSAADAELAQLWIDPGSTARDLFEGGTRRSSPGDGWPL
jgi:hypothetical protein